MIDDENNKVLMSFSSLSKEFKEKGLKGSNVKGASLVGELAGKKAVEKGIKKGVFDTISFSNHKTKLPKLFSIYAIDLNPIITQGTLIIARVKDMIPIISS